jgi:type III restriction enzyme
LVLLILDLHGNKVWQATEGQLLENIQNIQLGNGLKPSSQKWSRQHLDFTVGRLGTGKTYVYTRTIVWNYIKIRFLKTYYCCSLNPLSRRGLQIVTQITKRTFKGIVR